MISGQGISVFAGRKMLLDGVDISVRPGRFTAILGPNGAGKSTLVSVLVGERRPESGTVSLDGRPMAHWRPLELARRRAVLLQNASLDFAFTVEEVVELGRLPFAGTDDRFDDADALNEACRIAQVGAFRHRSYQTLSGGERQRVQFARAVAQIWQARDREGDAARFLLLDEPTSALDLRHQHNVLAAARQMTSNGVGVLAVVHDLNLACAYADDVVLLRDGRVLAAGPAQDVMTADWLGACFGVPVEILVHNDRRFAIIA